MKIWRCNHTQAFTLVEAVVCAAATARRHPTAEPPSAEPFALSRRATAMVTMMVMTATTL